MLILLTRPYERVRFSTPPSVETFGGVVKGGYFICSMKKIACQVFFEVFLNFFFIRVSLCILY